MELDKYCGPHSNYSVFATKFARVLRWTENSVAQGTQVPFRHHSHFALLTTKFLGEKCGLDRYFGGAIIQVNKKF